MLEALKPLHMSKCSAHGSRTHRLNRFSGEEKRLERKPLLNIINISVRLDKHLTPKSSKSLVIQVNPVTKTSPSSKFPKHISKHNSFLTLFLVFSCGNHQKPKPLGTLRTFFFFVCVFVLSAGPPDPDPGRLGSWLVSSSWAWPGC